MNQADWVGDVKAKKFKDIGNTRPSVAEEKPRYVWSLVRCFAKFPTLQRAVAFSKSGIGRWRTKPAKKLRAAKSQPLPS